MFPSRNSKIPFTAKTTSHDLVWPIWTSTNTSGIYFHFTFCTSLKTCCTSYKLLQKVRKYTKFTHYWLTFSCRQFGPGPGKDNLVTLISDITWFMNSALHEVPSSELSVYLGFYLQHKKCDSYLQGVHN